MPNWCNNTITITGPKDKITKLYETAKKENGLLQAMYPMPKELEDTTSPAPKEGKPQPLVDGYDNWYDWRVQKWGSKWDVDVEGLELDQDGTKITGWFDSAWSPPIGAYEHYLTENEDCSIDSFYEEGGMDFAGNWVDFQDDFCDQISNYARQKIKTGDSGDTLYDYLDDHLELTENRREYIEEELNEEAQKVHDFVVEKKAVNGKMEA
tara:strand:- start:757 stop:1383 length:627 start_codon:yes stop_codon:yes gene_type:complete